MWIGVDDTDGPSGGCTTHVLTEIVRTAGDRGYDVVGEPRLVRLNPNVPWKTRGNGALAVRLGVGQGARTRIGEIGGRPVWSYRAGRPVATADRTALVDALWRTVLEGSARDRATDPALVAGTARLPGALYELAVRTVVPVEAAERALAHAGYDVRVSGSRRGLVGAAAAIAWPDRRRTWELLAYRRLGREGVRRAIDIASVRAAARRHRGLFLCYDERTRRLLVAPHTPCPILFGLRSTDPRSLRPAAREVVSEPVDRWLRFRTNQGTGDHVRGPPAALPGPYSSGRFVGTVARDPVLLRGGHVRFELEDRSGRRVTCLAFEPSKTLNAVARSLIPGERLEVWGGRGRDPTFRIEGIVLGERPVQRLPGPRPRCTVCHRTARSLGRGRGYRCPGCRRLWPPEARSRTVVPPRFGPGTYHPTPSARRHLAPLAPSEETDL